MDGINLNQPIHYRNASLYYFAPKEHHVTRLCNHDVLLLVFEGCLRFTEDGIHYEIHPGQYFIQKKGSYQTGTLPSDEPKYLYIHFQGTWTNEDTSLQRQGVFSISDLMPLMEQMDRASHNGYTDTEQVGIFFQILTELYRTNRAAGTGKASAIAKYIRNNCTRQISLDELSGQFCYSKNQIINLLRSGYGMTPVEYLNRARIKKAEWLMKVTSKTLTEIAAECGYGDYSRFYKVFSRIHKSSPTNWRKIHRGE